MLEAAGATADRPIDGRSMLPFARDARLRTRRPVLHEGLGPGDIDRDGAPRSGTGRRVPRDPHRPLPVGRVDQAARSSSTTAPATRARCTRAIATPLPAAPRLAAPRAAATADLRRATSAASRSGRSAAEPQPAARICWRLRRCRARSPRRPRDAARPHRPARRRAGRARTRSGRADQRLPLAGHAFPRARARRSRCAARRASRLGRIRVTGSKSGRHTGRLRAHSDGQGASFVLARKLRRGERVTVRTDLPVRGARNGDFTFRTARIPRRVTIQNLILENIPAKKTRKFRSRRDLAPPFVNVNTRAARPGARLPVPEPEVEEGREAGRPDDRRRQRAADLVPAAAGHPGGHRLPRADLQGQAGADLLAGHLAPGHRRRRDGDARPVLPRDPPDPHAQRLPARPARVQDHAARHGAHHQLPDRAPDLRGGEGRRSAASPSTR